MKLRKVKSPPQYAIEQGMVNPSKPGEVGWRFWDQTADKAKAMTEANRLAKVGGHWRVVESYVVATTAEPVPA